MRERCRSVDRLVAGAERVAASAGTDQGQIPEIRIEATRSGANALVSDWVN